MMTWLHHRTGLYLWLTVLSAWLITDTTAMVHDVEVAHVWCPEHGDLIELQGAGPTASADADGPTWHDASRDAHPHDHGCALAGAATPADERFVLIVPRSPPQPTWPAVSVATCCAPRPPPLSYAPKNGPPKSASAIA